MSKEHWRVIVVEDNFDDLQVVLTILKYHGIQAHGVESAAECADLLTSVVPHAVITDLAMPNWDGWDVLTLVRKQEQEQHIPVAAMTAYHSDKLAAEVYQGGFDAYFPKPLEPDEFLEGLAAIIED